VQSKKTNKEITLYALLITSLTDGELENTPITVVYRMFIKITLATAQIKADRLHNLANTLAPLTLLAPIIFPTKTVDEMAKPTGII